MKKEAQYFETVIIGTGFSGLLAAINVKSDVQSEYVAAMKNHATDGLANWWVYSVL